MKILIVDDENLDLFITKKLLGMEFEVEGFNTIEEAAAWAEKNSFDLLLTDFYLAQGKKAQDVLMAVRSVTLKPFRAMVLSNHIDGNEAAGLKNAGFDTIIDKPITLEKFKEALTNLNS